MRSPKTKAKAIESFVNGSTAPPAEESPAPAIRSKAKSKVKPERRRQTVYFRPDVHKKLRTYIALNDLELSLIVDQAVEKFLNEQS